MSLIAFQCACGQRLQAPPEQGGRAARCPTCRVDLSIPPAATIPDATIPHVPCPACAEPVLAGTEICEHCRERIVWRTRAQRHLATRASRWWSYKDRPGLPWDDPSEGTLPTRLVGTLRALLLEPATAFRSTFPDGSFGQPYLFALWMTLLAATAGVLTLVGTLLVGPASVGPEAIVVAVVAGGCYLTFGALWPFFVGLFLHYALVFTGGATRPLESTLRVSCYAFGASAIALVLPMPGWAVFLVWSAGLQAVGLREIHGISGFRAILTVFAPFLLVGACCGTCAGGL